MFTTKEKHKISQAVERVLLEINHPEMPKEKLNFTLHVVGKELPSWAEIVPNWKFKRQGNPENPNKWNETQGRK